MDSRVMKLLDVTGLEKREKAKLDNQDSMDSRGKSEYRSTKKVRRASPSKRKKTLSPRDKKKSTSSETREKSPRKKYPREKFPPDSRKVMRETPSPIWHKSNPDLSEVSDIELDANETECGEK